MSPDPTTRAATGTGMAGRAKAVTSDRHTARVGRATTCVAAANVDPALPDEVDQLLQPLLRTLDGPSAAHPRTCSALAFDPEAAMGHCRPLEQPRLPAQPMTEPYAAEEAPSATQLPWVTATQIATLVQTGRASAVDVVEAHTRRLREVEPLLNAFIMPTVEQARASASANPAGRLAGVVVGLKDMIDAAGLPTSCGSRLHSRLPATKDATAWGRLRTAGCLLMGKLNTHEYAAGVTSENDHYGHVRNPWNTERVSGGSSGGSAAAVASALVSLSLGTDTGGSVRIPASFCGVVGYKPTFGLVDTSGVQPLAPSLDHVGPFARTVGDAAACLDVIAETECEASAASGSMHGLAGVRVAVPWEWLAAATKNVRNDFEAALSVLERGGAEIVDTPTLPDLNLLTALNRVIAYAEGSSSHEDKLRSGARFGSLVQPRMEAGRRITASQYLAAQRTRRLICEELAQVWSYGHLMATPTVPCAPPTLDSRSVQLPLGEEPIGNALVKYTAPFSLTGAPAVTVPSGWDDQGLPTGLQLTGPPHADRLVFFAASSYEATRNQLTRHRNALP